MCHRVSSCAIVCQAHILPRLAAAGFEGVYKCKTRESMGATGKVDGCALLWRRSKFRLVEQYAVEFNEARARASARARERATAAARTTMTTVVRRASPQETENRRRRRPLLPLSPPRPTVTGPSG